MGTAEIDEAAITEASDVWVSPRLRVVRRSARDAGWEPAVWSYIIPWHSLNSEPVSKSWTYECVKRLLDIAGSVIGLVVAIPVMMVAAIAIKATSRGPVLFVQWRPGHGGRQFRCLKLRTMVVDAEQVLAQDGQLRQQFADGFKIRDDPRITPTGAFLRRTSIDELPQFFNVILGDMSLVGPRPVVGPELEHFGEFRDKLHSVKPGLGGLWQVCGRSETSPAERIQMDISYVEHRSLSLDLRLMVLTFLTVVKRRGAC